MRSIRIAWRPVTRGLVFALAVLLIAGCDSEGSESDEVMVSRFGETDSHNAGKNCMTCHRAGGQGEGVFVVAGTVYEQDGITINPGTVVNIYSQPARQGALLLSLEVDARGNFYTTEDLSFDAGLYATVSSSTETALMVSPATTGACNSCHGQSVAAITAP